jgi:glycosyltransferase involved in cell wall biosynthesis
MHVAAGIATAAKQLNNDVDIFSTDGAGYAPKDLEGDIIGYVQENETQIFGRPPTEKYDAQISYTCIKNFPHYFTHCDKNRLGIWCYEWLNGMPNGFAKHYKSVDYLCPPSNFAKRVFVEAGVPEDRIRVISHGINSDDYRKTDKIELNTGKSFVLCANIAQNHLRKNIPGLLDAYGKAFTNKDDVCLILKGKDKKVTMGFEVSLSDCIKEFNRKYPKHAEMKLMSQYIPDMSALYRSVDAFFTMTHCECYLMPALEILASSKICIAPRWGGQMDFLNDDNSLLIDGKETRATPESMYWESKNNAIWFQPSVDDAVSKLRYAYNNYEALNKKVEAQREQVLETYNWTTITKRFLALMQ